MATPKTVFIYARRSSEKNKLTSISIEKQIDEITAYCVEKGLKIIGVYKDNKTGFVAGMRDDFTEMLREIDMRNLRGRWERVDYVYVYMASRLARNFPEGDVLKNLVLNEHVEILSYQERGIDCSTISGRRQLVDLMTAAVFESLEKSSEAIKNMDKTYQRWFFAKVLPMGYSYEGRGDYRKVIVDTKYRINEAIIRIFELYSKGKYSYEGLAEELKKEGFVKYYHTRTGDKTRNFTSKDIETILQREFYWGKVEVRYSKIGKDVERYFLQKYPEIEIKGGCAIIDYTEIFEQLGTFTPLISKMLFNKCREIREGKKNWPKGGWRENEEVYPWKGIIRCPCQWKGETSFKETYGDLRFFTSETKVKKSGKRYQYYRCSRNKWGKCDNEFVSSELIEDILYEEVISKLVMDEWELSIMEFTIKAILERKGEIEVNANSALKQKIGKLEAERKRFLDFYVSEPDEDVREDLKARIREIKTELEETHNQLNVLPDVMQEGRDKIKDSLFYATELATQFPSFPVNKKRAVVKAIFKYAVFHKKRLIDFELHPLFEGIFERRVLTNPKGKRKKKEECSNSENSKGKPLLASL